jgi:hypothetical protein
MAPTTNTDFSESANVVEVVIAAARLPGVGFVAG